MSDREYELHLWKELLHHLRHRLRVFDSQHKDLARRVVADSALREVRFRDSGHLRYDLANGICDDFGERRLWKSKVQPGSRADSPISIFTIGLHAEQEYRIVITPPFGKKRVFDSSDLGMTRERTASTTTSNIPMGSRVARAL